jgi:hypothetical protein
LDCRINLRDLIASHHLVNRGAEAVVALGTNVWVLLIEILR